MKWKKLGKIFDPYDHILANNCFGYAQSPQPIVFHDFVRIYFSAREKDSHGKYLSHVSYVDFDKDFKNVLKLSDTTIIPLGDLGCFDEHGIFPFSVTKTEDKILAYTTGWNRKVSVSADASIGLAYSEDGGESFKKLGNGPVMTASLSQPFLVCDAFVNIFEGLYHMWYIFGQKWIDVEGENEPQRVYKIAHATSTDGISWNREEGAIISDILNVSECQALPTVVRIQDTFHMFFCYRDAVGFRTDRSKAYRIGHAYSKDLKHWIREDDNPAIYTTDGSWDSDMMCYPCAFQVDDSTYLLYNGNEFGKYGFGLAKLEV